MEVRLEGISKSFGATQILDNINLVFPSRKFVTLLGPSGCGKTTLLRMIAGLEEITSGNIRFGDRVVNALQPRQRNIAMVFQSYALYPQMTVRKNLGYGLRVRGTSREATDEAVERVAHILEIFHLLDRKPAQLSGGQRQRVALGRAMVRRPDIFLMDEPLSNLDAKLRVTMRGELRRFHLDLDATTIYVTHDQLEAMTMSDLIAVMHGGVVQQFGTPAEVYNSPANLFVAGFIGSPPMNFLQGTLIESGSGVAFAGPGVTLALPRIDGSAAGTDVVLGARPQDLELTTAAEPDAAQGRVWVVELIGSEKLIEVELQNKRRVTVQVRADSPVQVDDAVGVRLDPNRMHIFAANDGRAIGRG
ncbi:MAG: multiple sugar transport system ATP-binding protein [Variibacter sp.]|jgi:ABC-type sugar transport system ATPase subunit|nr:multiple sugar transport system ATP-binding protein [Variibacter sp.]